MTYSAGSSPEFDWTAALAAVGAVAQTIPCSPGSAGGTGGRGVSRWSSSSPRFLPSTHGATTGRGPDTRQQGRGGGGTSGWRLGRLGFRKGGRGRRGGFYAQTSRGSGRQRDLRRGGCGRQNRVRQRWRHAADGWAAFVSEGERGNGLAAAAGLRPVGLFSSFFCAVSFFFSFLF